MGCTGSNPRKGGSSAVTRFNNPLTDSEIKERVDAAPSSQNLKIAGVTIRYGWVSQRGYYPDALNKDNQDSYYVSPNFGSSGVGEQALFCVFDGHGRDGHFCARYARDHLPVQLLSALERVTAAPSMKSAAVKEALIAAHVRTNSAMHAERNFDDSLSGTTSVSILLRGRTMFISNVGDSRAVLISTTEDGRLVAKPLSNDQTPYRKDERERCKKTGARILSMDQIEGIEPIHENWGDLNLGEDIDEEGDPPRIWSPHGDYPGSAFTRSLGDRVAEECGVFAEPEIVEKEIKSYDKYLVIASDGVFEFLTNQMVATELSRHTDPVEACRAIVNKAYHLWLQYEVRTDDITIIALYLDSIEETGVFSPSSSFYDKKDAGSNTAGAGAVSVDNPPPPPPPPLPISRQNSVQLAGDSSGQRPVRRVMSREKRKLMIEMENGDGDLADEADDISGPLMRLSIGGNNPSDADLDSFIIPKSAADAAFIGNAIKTNFLFQHLSVAQHKVVIGMMEEVNVKAGERVIRQGDKGDRFYLIHSGKFEVRVKATTVDVASSASNSRGSITATTTTTTTTTSAGGGGQTLVAATIGSAPEASALEFVPPKDREEQLGGVIHVYEPGPHNHPGFGELSLMYGKPRAASVIAQTDGRLWALDRKLFSTVVLRSRDIRKGVVRALRSVEIFQALNLGQLQQLTDLLSEQTYAAGECIVRQGQAIDQMYVVVSGTVACSVDTGDTMANASTSTAGNKTVQVKQLKALEYFGEQCLLESVTADFNFTAASSSVKVLHVGRSKYEEVLGPLASSIDAQKERRRERSTTFSSTIPQKFKDIIVHGLISTDTVGPILLGQFGVHVTALPNYTVRSFLLSDASKHKSYRDSISRYAEATRVIADVSASSASSSSSLFIPCPVAFLRDPNAVHMVFDRPVVSDLSTLIRANSEAIVAAPEIVTFLFACLVAALEALHGSMRTIYRAVQPESLYVDAMGRLVLLDYRFCKVLPVSSTAAAAEAATAATTAPATGKKKSYNNTTANTSAAAAKLLRTFTLCGAADYLSPEQVSQSGHSYPVDLWAMGVLLYEMTVGSHPFSGSSEIATYSRISSFGSKSFPTLDFPEQLPADTRSLINQLLVPAPEARIGADSGGFSTLRRHPFFKAYRDNWHSAIEQGEDGSPAMALAKDMHTALLQEGVDPSIAASFVAKATASSGGSDPGAQIDPKW
eukprot:CAMPEP_0174958214 /NCGR_PEP_ID=MMETSP0004_2-20121128/2501_1 /TAXON_ID=420556 /ORGANISM="Ochromonas sp., Strain CCMP1393" /LENGTH=1206 /DNA_ID=CAMNT_0016206405 /DNA_START=132 /DNA_END=3749 /DNA_ORIENTATION=-